MIHIDQIKALKEQINALSKGYISKKNVRGITYFYHQWSEKGIKKDATHLAAATYHK